MASKVLLHIPGQGSIVKRERSPFLYLDYSVAGEPFRLSTEIPYNDVMDDKSKARAIRQACEMLAQRKGRGPGEHVTHAGLRLTVRQAIDEYRAHRQASAVLTSPQLSQLRRIEKDLGRFKVMDLTHDGLNAWVSRLLERGKGGKPYSRDTVHTLVAYLGVVLRLAQQAHRLPSLPRIPEVGNLTVRQGFTTGEDFAKTLEHVQSPVIRDLLEFLFHYGWRRSEPLSLTWDQVNFEYGTVILVKSKTGRGRAVPMTPAVMELFQRRLADRVDGCSLVFHEDGLGINRDRVTRVLKAACGAAQVKVITTHDLRRTAARDLIASGADASAAKAITGHQTLSMFDRYNIQDLRGAQATMDRLSAFRGLAPRQSTTLALLSGQEVQQNQANKPSRRFSSCAKSILIQAYKSLIEMRLGTDWRAWI